MWNKNCTDKYSVCIKKITGYKIIYRQFRHTGVSIMLFPIEKFYIFIYVYVLPSNQNHTRKLI